MTLSQLKPHAGGKKKKSISNLLYLANRQTWNQNNAKNKVLTWKPSMSFQSTNYI